jgi:hypothetical protein
MIVLRKKACAAAEEGNVPFDIRRPESDPIDDRIETGNRKRPGEFCCVFDIRCQFLQFAGHIA